MRIFFLIVQSDRKLIKNISGAPQAESLVISMMLWGLLSYLSVYHVSSGVTYQDTQFIVGGREALLVSLRFIGSGRSFFFSKASLFLGHRTTSVKREVFKSEIHYICIAKM